MRTFIMLMALVLVAGFATEAAAQALFKRAQDSGKSVDWYAKKTEKPRAWQKHDTVMIKINSTTSADRQDRFEGRKEFSADASLADFPRLGKGLAVTPSALGDLKLDFESELETRDEGKRRRRSQLTDSVMAEITEVLPNYDVETNTGSVRVRAFKEIRVGGDIERVELTGTISVQDIRADRSVLSERVLNLTIQYYGEGDVSNYASPGWLAKIIGWCWPF